MNIPIGSDNSDSPWNEKKPIYKNFDIEILLIRKERMKLEVDEDGNILPNEHGEIVNWSKYIAESLSCEFENYEIL